MNGRRRNTEELWRVIRERMITETGRYLTECLRRPELAVTIPAVPANQGGFPAVWAEHFWQSILFDN